LRERGEEQPFACAGVKIREPLSPCGRGVGERGEE
jgi:hypothetical protein